MCPQPGTCGGYDNEPLIIMDEKDAIRKGFAGNWILCFEHDPVVAAAGIQKENGRVVAGPAVAIWILKNYCALIILR
ncbi:MAG: hypothetical protein R2874_09080 [Desulfobacterales bacterium]